MEELIRLLVLEDGGASRILGERFFLDTMPQDSARPYAVLQLLGESTPEDAETLNGPSSYFAVPFAITCYAMDEVIANRLAKFIRKRLNRIGRKEPDRTLGDVTLQDVFFEDAVPGFRELQGSHQGVYAKVLNFRGHITEQ